jgi:hypothetical protein
VVQQCSMPRCCVIACNPCTDLQPSICAHRRSVSLLHPPLCRRSCCQRQQASDAAPWHAHADVQRAAASVPNCRNVSSSTLVRWHAAPHQQLSTEPPHLHLAVAQQTRVPQCLHVIMYDSG